MFAVDGRPCAIDRLRSHHLVERTGEGYVLTFPARRLLEIYDQ